MGVNKSTGGPQIAHTSIIKHGVELGKNTRVEDFCIIGMSNDASNEFTRIGENSLIRSGTYIYAGNQIGERFFTGNKVNVRENNEIGDDVSIGTLSVIEHSVTIGNGVRIHSNCFVPEYTVLEDGVWIGPGVVITNSKYPNKVDSKALLEGVRICRNAVVGASVTILPGITVGEGALIGAGTIVLKDVPPNSLILYKQQSVVSLT